LVGRLRVVDVGVEWDGFLDEAGDAGIAIAEMSYGAV